MTKLIVAEGKEDITIQNLRRRWRYSEELDPTSLDIYVHNCGSDAEFRSGFQPVGTSRHQWLDLDTDCRLAGLYARYFGGDLKLISMEG